MAPSTVRDTYTDTHTHIYTRCHRPVPVLRDFRSRLAIGESPGLLVLLYLLILI